MGGRGGGYARIALVSASSLVIFAGVVGGRAGAFAMVLAAVAFPVLLLAAVVHPGRSSSRFRLVVASFAALLLTSGLGVYALSGSGPYVLGLPVAAWLMLGGLIAGSLVVAGGGYAWTFEE